MSASWTKNLGNETKTRPQSTRVRKQSNLVEPRLTEASRTPAECEHLVIKDSFLCPSGESPYKSSKFNSFSKDTSLMRTTDAFSCLINIRFSDHRKSNSLMRKLYYQLCGAVAKCLVLGINCSSMNELLLTPDNSKPSLTQTKIDCYTFTVILPSVTRTLGNSNLPLTQRNFCFPSDHFYIVLPSITRTMF